ncbi:MAG: VTC domain-containing protein [Bacteroidetes bacterium]|nr:VTC domain-containing protein [Bacteroidota bacterium]
MNSAYTELNTYRYERKFVANQWSRHQTEAVVKQNSAFFVSAFHPRRVNNIYFDTPGLDCYFDNLFGNGNRWKARIRWYDDIFGKAVSPILEFKIKKGLAGTKKSFALPDFIIYKAHFDASELKNVFEKANLPEEISERIACLQPVLLNSYLRSYFSTFDKKFRITVDSDLEYYNLRPSWNSFNFKHSEGQKVVVELKYDMELDKEANKISTQFPFRLDKNSKFVAGMSFFRSEIAE